MLYHVEVETLLTIGYSKLGRKLLRRPAPNVDFDMGDIGMFSINILLAMATRDMLIKQGIIPAHIMKEFTKVASAVAMMIGGTVVYALSGGILLLSKPEKTQDAEKERDRHDKAVEQLEAD